MQGNYVTQLKTSTVRTFMGTQCWQIFISPSGDCFTSFKEIESSEFSINQEREKLRNCTPEMYSFFLFFFHRIQVYQFVFWTDRHMNMKDITIIKSEGLKPETSAWIHVLGVDCSLCPWLWLIWASVRRSSLTHQPSLMRNCDSNEVETVGELWKLLWQPYRI